MRSRMALCLFLCCCYGDQRPCTPPPVVSVSNEPPARGHSDALTAVTPNRCLELPELAPWRPNPDWPSPLNSDHTPKRLPPGPPSEPGYTVLFRYDDFGAQSMQNGLLGFSWWSWEPGGSFEPGDEFDVRVVVHRERSPEQLDARYPTVKGKSDYRFVGRDDALAYLDRMIAELKGYQAQPDDEFDWGPSIRGLEATRSVILACLP